MIRLTAVMLVCIAMVSAGAWAVEVKSGGSVVIGNQQPVNEDVVAAGTDVSVRPTVKGDVTAAGQSVAVSGPVTDSVFAAGESVTVTGKAGNDVRLAGREVALAAPVGDAAYLAGSTVRVLENASIGSDLLAAGGDIVVMGSVGGNARLAGAKIVIGGPVTGNVYARGTQISLLSGARIKGNLYYDSANAATIAPGAVVQGKIVHSLPSEERRRLMFWPALAWWLLWLAAAILFAVVLIVLFPISTQAAADTVNRSFGLSLLTGLLALIVTPIVALVAMVTVVGLPLGFALLMMYFILLYAAKVFVSLCLGQWILARAGMSGGAGSPIVALILGLVVLSLLGLIPFVGWLVGLVVLLAGSGGFLLSWGRDRRGREVVPAA